MAGIENAVADDVLLEMLERLADLVGGRCIFLALDDKGGQDLVLRLGDGFLAVFLLGNGIG
jgi:hypothetical protein